MVSGKVRNVDQFVMGGFEIAEKISAIEAYDRFPEQRLSMLRDGQVTGNVIVDADGKQHELDHHERTRSTGGSRTTSSGTNPIVLADAGRDGRGAAADAGDPPRGLREEGQLDPRDHRAVQQHDGKADHKLRALLDAVKNTARQPRAEGAAP